LGRKYWTLLAGLVGLCLLLTCLISLGLILIVPVFKQKAAAPTNTIAIKGHTFQVEYADTPAEQEKGLGDRASLPANQAMLFRFPTAAKQCFWMKDMHFFLDIIWLNSDKQVVHIEPDLSPQTYPKYYCADGTKYVIETNAGITQQLNLKTGETISF